MAKYTKDIKNAADKKKALAEGKREAAQKKKTGKGPSKAHLAKESPAWKKEEKMGGKRGK